MVVVALVFSPYVGWRVGAGDENNFLWWIGK